MALMTLCFTQCKPAPDGGEENTERKVKIRCEIPMNQNSRSDFSQLMTEGTIRWSDGRECVYLAVHGETPQIIELEAWADGDPLRLEFEGEAAEGLIVSGQEYDVWYFGHSQQLETPYINNDGEILTGSISTQSGRLEDLGYCHIAKTKVTAVTENDEVKLNLKGTLVNQMAIALLDLENVTELYGDAIVGTEYALEYDGERFELNVTEDDKAKINVESATGISYVVLLPNANKETMIKHKKEDKTFAYTFHNYIKSNKIYYRTATDDKVALKWEEIEEEPEQPSEPEQPGDNNGHEYVDLGLSVKWATCNVGASTPEEYGDYFAWGETTTKETYDYDNCPTYGLSISELQSQGYIDSEGNLTAQYDVATANWGGDWRMPTYAEQEELRNNCTWTWTTQNGVNGYNVEGPNGNSIFLPAAGYRNVLSLYYAGSYGVCWSSTPNGSDSDRAYYLYFRSSDQGVDNYLRYFGQSVRPVIGSASVEPEQPAAQYATVTTSEVTEITSGSVICGGNVTADNGSAVTARGICWSTSSNPTIEDNKTEDGSGMGSFTSQIPNLVPNTQYYVRAYATNAAGTSYGDELSFTTLEEEINEIDGHGYVDLGLPSGLKWATCNVGANAPEEYGDYFAWGETETKSEYTEENSVTYGRQMNDISGNAQFDAATANWGGNWRMPTKAEQQELLDYCTSTWTTQNGVNGYKVTGPNGNSIFLPAAGFRDGSSLSYAGSFGIYWSSTPYENYDGIACNLCFDSDFHYIDYYDRNYGPSVRPVYGGDFEGPAAQYATVTTSEVTEITSNSAICGGNVTTDNGFAVTAKGVCWSTSQNPTISDNKTTEGSGVGSFTSQISDLVPNTQYYVRAYATNAAGTSYGEQKSFTTLTAGPNANGHEYVDLGLPSGLLWATCNVGATTPEEYGNYYAWGETEPAPNNNYSSSNCSTSGLTNSQLQSQGYIDGNGNLTSQYDAATANWGGDWRMPTYAEFNELRNNCTWTWTTQNGVNGYNVEGPNGNSIFLPAAGYRYGSSLGHAGSQGGHWSSTPYGSGYAYDLHFSSSNHSMSYDYRRYGQTVRPVLE